MRARFFFIKDLKIINIFINSIIIFYIMMRDDLNQKKRIMQREILIFATVVIVALFMTIHNRNQNDLSQRELQFSEHKANRDNLLMKDGHLVKLGNGVTLSRSADLIIINQYESTIILNNEDVDEVVAFLED